MNAISRPSPNFSKRKSGIKPDMIVFHYTDMLTAESALMRLCDPAYEVSAHYLIDEKGTIYTLVDESKKAWHAGISCWRGRSALNDYSIGIELAHPGHTNGYIPFPDEQIKACIALCLDIKKRFIIPQEHIVAHSDIAPLRKKDPGELFPWDKLAAAGIGVCPPSADTFPKKNDILLFPHSKDTDAVRRVQSGLAAIGYYIKKDGDYGLKTEKTIEAFKRRFVTRHVSVTWDEQAEFALGEALKTFRHYTA